MIYRLEAPLYYANADFFMREVLGLIQKGDPALRWFVVRFSRISDVDYSASKMLEELIRRLQADRLTLVFCDVDEGMRIGISMGGNTLLHMATLQPKRIDAMVLVSATMYFPDQARAIMRQVPGSRQPAAARMGKDALTSQVR